MKSRTNSHKKSHAKDGNPYLLIHPSPPPVLVLQFHHSKRITRSEELNTFITLRPFASLSTFNSHTAFKERVIEEPS